jgi:two-component system nitrogen regulation sensor histidine kinase NtrY
MWFPCNNHCCIVGTMMASARPALNPERPAGRFRITPAVEAGVVALVVMVAVATYLVIDGSSTPQLPLSPQVIALLLLANLVPAIALLMLVGRRIAKRRAARSLVGGDGELHVRLVTIFSISAAVPALLVAIFASLLFQYGVSFWSSGRATGLLENARTLVQENYQREIDSVVSESRTMSGDLARELRSNAVDSRRFQQYLVYQTYQRALSEAMIIRRGDRDPLIVLNPYGRPLENLVTPAIEDALDHGAPFVVTRQADRIGVVVPLAWESHAYVYTGRIFQGQLSSQMRRGDAIISDYEALKKRSRSLQLRFNAALLLISLLIVGIAVWIALTVADRLVRPVGELVEAARRIAAGDLTARVSDTRTRDEIGTLANAFNQMTDRLEQQNTELLTANNQLDNRRALIEAVMAGVSAGVISLDDLGTVRIANRSADELIGSGDDGLVGRSLASVAPELSDLVASREREAIIQVAHGADMRTLAVRIAHTDAGPILTFDDITQQVLDQRRAAWSDVARRIAHEIKNPLTPIQLAAERLQRRYGSKIDPDDVTFGRLTETIIRQVGDLRRMVDEFSSFARMPKPVFREESLVDIARQTLFLHEVAHPGITFTLDHDPAQLTLVCDRRQLGQAFTNIVKNAVEAIEAKGEANGSVMMRLREVSEIISVEVMDTGIGLPPERDRIVEPYMTTRARGTGLGLAIVTKIIEEHHGTIAFADRDGGGTVVRMSFDAAALAASDAGGNAPDAAADSPLAALTRNRN